MTSNEGHVLPEKRAGNERESEPLNTLKFFGRQSIGIARIDGGHQGIAQFARVPIDLNDAFGKIDPVQQRAVAHIPFGMSRNQLPFELELKYRGGFLHPSDKSIFT